MKINSLPRRLRFLSDSKKIKLFYLNRYKIKFECYYWPKSIEDPSETPDHFSIFNYWVLNKLKNKKFKILDLGNTKYGLMISSIYHKVDSICLVKPNDGDISTVNYLVSDVQKFSTNKEYDIITSPSTIHLLGTGRYGDEVNVNAIEVAIKSLYNSLKKNGKLFVALPLGMDQYCYEYHFIFSFDSILKLFQEFELIDFFVDEQMNFNSSKKSSSRFSKDTTTSTFNKFQYKIIYLHFEKK